MVHKTRKKPYHQVTYYHHVTYITNDNRTVASWKKKPKENNASLIPRRSVERKKIPRQPKRAQQIAKLRLFVWDMMR